MFRLKIYPTIIITLSVFMAQAQETIQLPISATPSIKWANKEMTYFSGNWKTEVVTNVSKPSMQLFLPEAEKRNGTTVVIAPGGGLFALSIESEGNKVARWLMEKGVTAAVLKYRLVPTGNDAVEEMSESFAKEPQKTMDKVRQVLPHSIQDGLNAIAHLRKKADQYGIDPNKIGFMGFSAGGAVGMGVIYDNNGISSPDFFVPVYAWTDALAVQKPNRDTPPTFIVCATDDPLGLAKGSMELYNSLVPVQDNVALHLYAKGGHGFGMKKQNLPSDNWIEAFYNWAVSEQLIEVD